MVTAKFSPSPDLAHLIRYYWFFESQAQDPCFDKILPFGAIDIIAHRELPMQLGAEHGGQMEPALFIEGQYLKYVYKKPASRTSFVGISLFPWATSTFLKIPALEFTKRVIDIDLIDKDLHSRLTASVRYHKSNHDLVAELDNIFRQQVTETASTNQQKLIRLSKNLSNERIKPLKSLTKDEWKYSSRLLQTQFKELFGITPKEFQSKHRFQIALQTIRNNPKVNLTRLGLSCGYYDQAHFIKSFKQFAGITPKKYSSEMHSTLGSLSELTQASGTHVPVIC